MPTHRLSVALRPGWAENLVAARAGSSEALGRLLDDFRPYLLAVAGSALDTDLQAKAGASDLVQESLLEAQRDFTGFAGQKRDQLQTWLVRILLRNVQNFRRLYRDTGKRDVGREVPLPAHGMNALPGDCLATNDSSPSGNAARGEKEDRLRRALAQLPGHYRDVIAWRHRDGDSFAAIGARLGRTAEAARVLWGRALLRLKDELGDES
jgi:RNA polymerase sigma-70 factor (ECF subfamily)